MKLPDGTSTKARAGTEKSQNRDIRLGFLIHDVSRLRRTVFDRAMNRISVTRAQWWVLAHLSRHDGMMQSQLAKLLDVGKVSLGGLVDRLVTGGWVERRPDAVDRRVKRVYLSRKSQQLLQEMRNIEADFNALLYHGLSDKDRDELSRLLTVMKQNLGQMDFPQGESEEERAEEE